MSSSELTKSRRSLLLLLLVFALPIVAAKLALENHWFHEAVTNQGQLLKEELSLSELNITDAELQPKWLMIYPLPPVCDQQCEQTLYGMNQTYISLGSEMNRVVAVGLSASAIDHSALDQLRKGAWHFSQSSEETKNRLESDHVYLADPLGKVLLSYPVPQSQQATIDFGKALLADLRKLLKYSKIG